MSTAMETAYPGKKYVIGQLAVHIIQNVNLKFSIAEFFVVLGRCFEKKIIKTEFIGVAYSYL